MWIFLHSVENLMIVPVRLPHKRITPMPALAHGDVLPQLTFVNFAN